jgi:hypothetical protein
LDPEALGVSSNQIRLPQDYNSSYYNNNNNNNRLEHSGNVGGLIGSLRLDPSSPIPLAQTPQSQMLFRILIVMGQGYKRILYFESAKERDSWFKKLTKAQGSESKRVTDHYIINDSLIGEGSFGKVYTGMSLRTGREVAIKKIDISEMCKGELEFQVEELAINQVAYSDYVG